MSSPCPEGARPAQPAVRPGAVSATAKAASAVVLSIAVHALCSTLALAVMAASALASSETPQTAQPRALRACVDPDNLPYSHASRGGYEPAVARLLAEALQLPLELHWQPMRRGMVRKTLGERVCDVLISVPKGLETVLTTRPYYRASYVVVTRADDTQPLQSFDDARLAQLRIGVQLIGDDGATSPPGLVLARRGAVSHVVGFTFDGGSQEGVGPAAQRMVAALQRRELDAAFVWGPQAGWFAAQATPPMAIGVLQPSAEAGLPFEFAIALGVRRGETAWRDRLQQALDARQDQIDAVLREWHVPRSLPGAAAR